MEKIAKYGLAGIALAGAVALGIYGSSTRQDTLSYMNNGARETVNEIRSSENRKEIFKDSKVKASKENNSVEKKVNEIPSFSPQDLESKIRAYFTDELKDYEKWDTKESFMVQYGEALIGRERKLTVKQIISYLDKSPELRKEMERSFGYEIANLYSKEFSPTQEKTIEYLILMEGGLSTEDLKVKLWETEGDIFVKRGQRDLFQRMLLDQGVFEKIKRDMGGEAGATEFYNSLSRVLGVNVPQTFFKDLTKYYSGSLSKEEKDEVSNRINSTLTKGRLNDREIAERFLDGLSKGRGNKWDALGIKILLDAEEIYGKKRN